MLIVPYHYLLSCTILIFVLMKFLLIIFAFCIAVLNITPTLEMLASDDLFCATSCCEKSEGQKDTDNDGKSCKRNCNPFLSCCTCSGDTPPVLSLLYQRFLIVAETNSNYQQSPTIQYSYTFWHPPKLS